MVPRRGGRATPPVSAKAPYPSPGRTLDVLKFDIDSCDCHYIEVLLRDSFFHAKLLQVETNHHLPPPIVWKDMCLNGVNGRVGKGWDVWGCSVQAAYDVVKRHGYELLQYDFPDALFVKSEFRGAFPCMRFDAPGAGFERAYWVGYWSARDHYNRFASHQQERDFNAAAPEFASRAFVDPAGALQVLLDKFGGTLGKGNEMWVEVGVAGTRVAGNITWNGAPVLTLRPREPE